MKMSGSSHILRRSYLLLAGLLVFTSTGLAQERPNFAQLRTAELSEANRTAVRTWLQAQVQALLATDQPKQTIQQANDLLFGPQGLVTVYKSSDAARRFQVDLAEVLAGVFQEQYDNLPSDPKQRKPLATAYILIAFKEFAEPAAALDSLQKTLADPHASVRAVAAEGLAEIRERIPAPAWEPHLGKLQVAGSKERNGLVLGALYRALSVENENRRTQAAETMLKILDARFERFEQQGEIPTVADGNAVSWLAANAGQIGDAQTYNRITRAAARLLADAVFTYTQTELWTSKEQELEKNIYQVEEDLESLYSAKARASVPSVRDIMRRSGEMEKAPRYEAMMDKLLKWIGSSDTDGVLNGAPFNFPKGLGISRSKSEQE